MANRAYSWDDPSDAFDSSEELLDNTLNPEWVDNELVPLLDTAYGKQGAGYWEERVQEAMGKIDSLTIWEAFDSTVERFRLLLVNKEILSRAELEDFGSMRDKVDTCIAVFVRHALFNGPYKLHSLGTAPNPIHARAKITEENQDTYIFGGKLAMLRPGPPKQKKKDGEGAKKEGDSRKDGKRSRPHDHVKSDHGIDSTSPSPLRKSNSDTRDRTAEASELRRLGRDPYQEHGVIASALRPAMSLQATARIFCPGAGAHAVAGEG